MKKFVRVMAKRSDYDRACQEAYPSFGLREQNSNTNYVSHSFNVGGVSDFCRVSVSCADQHECLAAYKKLMTLRLDKGDPIEVVRSKNMFAPGAASSNGYRDVKLNVVVSPTSVGDFTQAYQPGTVNVPMIAEIQLILSEYLAVKKHMHVLYEIVRGDCFK